MQYRDINILRNSIWAPSAMLDLLGEVVGPPDEGPFMMAIPLEKFRRDRRCNVQVLNI